MTMINRRAALAVLAGATAARPGPAVARGAAKTLFGTMVNMPNLLRDPVYAQAIVRHAEIIVPEGGLKWDGLRPTPTTFGFGEGDDFVNFATRHGMAIRGTALAWENAMPAWAVEIDTAAKADLALAIHIDTVARRYAGRIGSWDVVNEPLPEDPAHPGERRASLWQKLLGDRHIKLALEATAAAAPGTELVINEYDLEFRGAKFDRKRRAMLDLVTKLKGAGAPLHAIGLQAHLHGDREIDRPALRKLIVEFDRMGLAILLTELDVMDTRLPADTAERDAAVADRADALLDTVFTAVRPRAVLTWGLTDRYAWIPDWFKRSDGAPNRPLPLDRDYQQKPFMRVLERYRKA